MITSLLLALALVSQTTDEAEPLPKTAAFQQVGTSVDNYSTLGASANTKYTLMRGNGQPGCIPFGSRVVFTSAGGGAIIHLTMTSTMGFAGAFTTQNATKVTGSGAYAAALGRASGPHLPITGSVAEEQVTYNQVFYGPGGNKHGICSARVSCLGIKSWIPCTTNNDCVEMDVTGRTCDTSSSLAGRDLALKTNGAAFVIFQGDTANTRVTVVRQK